MSEVWRTRRKVLYGASLLGLLASCESSTAAVTTNPESSLRLSAGELTPVAGCEPSSSDPADMSRYVVTLIDVTPDANEKVQPKAVLSGPPTSCTSSITFAVSADRGSLDVDHFYVAVVDGYVGADLTAAEQGERPLFSGSLPATPRWQWLCSFGGLSDETLEDLLAIASAVPTEPPPVPSSTGESSPAPDVTSSGDPGSVPPEAGVPDAAGSENTTQGTADGGVNGSDASTAMIDGSVFDGAVFDGSVSDGAVFDAARPTAPDGAQSDATPEPEPELVDAAETASSTESTNESSSLEPTATDAAAANDSPMSPLEHLSELADEPSAAPPAQLVQSRLATLRGCVVLP